MVTHPTRTPPKVYFISLLASSASPHCLVQMRTLCGEAPWRKQKKQKQYLATLWGEAPWRKSKKMKKNLEKTKKNNIWGLFGERPHGENQKNLKNLEKTKKNNIWGLLAGPPYPPRPLENCFFLVFFSFLEFFLVFQLSDSQDLWKIVFFVSMAYVHTCRYMWHLGHLQHVRFSIWFAGALGQANCFSCASSWVIGNPATIMLHILCFIRLSTVSFILLRWDPSAMNSEHDKNIVEHLGPKK